MSLLKTTGFIETPVGKIPQVSTELDAKDYWGAIKVRWGYKRELFKIEPGLYAIGNPDKNSDVLVTSNYKLSFDHVRKNLQGLHAWILVLDTKGVNVWCAAGKKTFSTGELVNRIQKVQLHQIVEHRRIIVPQLGATGISAHEVRKETSKMLANTPTSARSGIPDFNSFKPETGFKVLFGPVMAKDIKAFIESGYKATPEMREIEFSLWQRMKLVPNDFSYGKKNLMIAFLLFFIISVIGKWNEPFHNVFLSWLAAIFNIFMAYVAGIVLTPILLPFIPVKQFAFKGLIISMLTSTTLLKMGFLGTINLEIASWYLINGAIASFTAMNFTGSSTYTSLSGVKKEMRQAIPLQLAFAFFGLLGLIIFKVKIL